jgi:hypothetical protein
LNVVKSLSEWIMFANRPSSIKRVTGEKSLPYESSIDASNNRQPRAHFSFRNGSLHGSMPLSCTEDVMGGTPLLQWAVMVPNTSALSTRSV